jgi:large subunit ribosomal protein L25
MEEIVLNAELREVTGKAVKTLRRSGYVPAVMYGRRTEPVNLQIQDRALQQAMRQAGGNRLIALQVAGQEAKHVLAREVQRDALNHAMLHVDFYEVVMTEKLRTDVPIELIGEAAPVKKGEGLLFQGLDSIEIECLPGDLPANLQVSIAGLTAVDQAILVRDLQVSEAIKVLTDLDEIVAKIIPLAAEEVEEVAPAAAAPEVELVGKKAPEAEGEEAAQPGPSQAAKADKTGKTDKTDKADKTGKTGKTEEK